jgi:Domain of unknown function (DUF4263)
VFDRGGEDGVTYALGRRPSRTYFSRSFPLGLRVSRDSGQWARYAYKVFDEPTAWIERDDSSSWLEWTEELMRVSPRKQLKFQIARAAGEIRQLDIEQVKTVGGKPELQRILRLDRDGARRLVELIETLKHVPVEGDQQTVRIDDETLREFFSDPDAMVRLYEKDPQRFRDLIRSDASAEDVVALAHRKEVVERFRRLLADPEAFAEVQTECGGKPEAVWQRFLEENPWILGISLAGQLLQSWDNNKLEQVVAGSSIAGPGKRADAVLRTSGRIRSLVFAEIKHHKTRLLGASEYRSGCWPPSSELVGGVTQAQQTVDMAVRDIDRRLADTDEHGAETGEATWLIRPRSFLIIGDLEELRGPVGVHPHKHRSFELYRRNLYEPEIITFDELLARAEWHVEVAEQEELTVDPW